MSNAFLNILKVREMFARPTCLYSLQQNRFAERINHTLRKIIIFYAKWLRHCHKLISFQRN